MRRIALVIWLLLLGIRGTIAENPRHIDLGEGLSSVKTLSQNWPDDESNWFYGVAQGSRLIPYDWFVHLEQPGSASRFLDPDHIRGLGYIARKPSRDNPDGLPIGFTRDAAYKDGTAGVGVTCAACHTGQVNYKGTAYLIDGGPSLGDMERLFQRMVQSLELTHSNQEKFDRFAAKVLKRGSSELSRLRLRHALATITEEKKGYFERNFSQNHGLLFGPGRVDAFGAIFNEVSSTFLDIEDNVHPANAPVSYPCLWDAPQHDRVQWNGSAANRVSILGAVLFGTKHVGALGRNTGEVLGVFGDVHINSRELLLPRRYESTANKQHLIEIEESLTRLWSPRWPEEFGEIDSERRLRGEQIYSDRCVSCHAPIVRKDPSRKVVAILKDAKTDPQVLKNFGRTAQTGVLQGRPITLAGSERFGERANIGVMLKHVVERAMLNSLSPSLMTTAMNEQSATSEGENELNPGFNNVATVTINNKPAQIALESMEMTEGRVKIVASSESLEKLGQTFASASGLESASGVNLVKVSRLESQATAEGEISNATAEIGYKARPLNGVWATAPYLHNGSVPSLAELLKPAKDRVDKFHVGSFEFDPESVGFVDDERFPVFDATKKGNLNEGHDYAADLNDEQRRDLLEYLKSL